jgi:ABC-2 type transport system ATP-binding protein
MLCKRVAIIRDGRIIKVEEITNMRKKQLKKVKVSFNDIITAEKFNIPGMVNLLKIENALSFMYSGNIPDLISTLAQYETEDLTIEEPSLEEIFMHYYE